MPKKLLTKKKQAWVSKRKPEAVRGTPLHYSAASQERYAKKLTALVKQMTSQTERELIKFFKSPVAESFFAEDANAGSQARKLTNEITRRFNQLFASKAKPLSEQMVNDADRASSVALHSSLKQLSGGLSLKTTVVTGPMKEIMTAQVAENVALIKSISNDYLNQVQGAVMRSITTGNGLEDLVPFLQKYEGVTIRRARLIASDQTKKAFSNLNAERMKKAGVDQYEWVHSAAAKEPRELHVAMIGQIFSLDKPPIIQYAKGTLPEVRGKPGDLINCFCLMRPIITFDDGTNSDTAN